MMPNWPIDERRALSEVKALNAGLTFERYNPSSLLNATDLGTSQIGVAEAGRLAFISGQIATRATAAQYRMNSPNKRA